MRMKGIKISWSESSDCQGDTVRYENDKLYINNQETDEPYLADYLKRFKEDKLQSTYTGDSWDGKKASTSEVLLKKLMPLP